MIKNHPLDFPKSLKGFAPELYANPSTVSMVPNLSSWYGSSKQGYTDLNNNIQMNANQFGDSKTMVPDEVVAPFLQTMAHEKSHAQQSFAEKFMSHGSLHDQIDSNAGIVSRNLWRNLFVAGT